MNRLPSDPAPHLYVHLLDSFRMMSFSTSGSLMSRRFLFAGLLFAGLLFFGLSHPASSFAQSTIGSVTSLDQAAQAPSNLSAKKALGLSFLLPGLGHKYANEGKWSGWAVTYAAADVSLWVSLLGGEWHRNSLIESYTTLAAGSANAAVGGKDRSFFLNLASFESSDVFLETMLRNRQWDQIDYVSDPSYHWEWESEAAFNEFRSLRNDAESLRRRKTILIASLVVNRLLSGAISARKASQSNKVDVTASLSAPIETLPVLSLRVGF